MVYSSCNPVLDLTVSRVAWPLGVASAGRPRCARWCLTVKLKNKGTFVLNTDTNQITKIKLGKRKIILTDRDRENVMFLFHSCYLSYGFVSITQDEFLKIFSDFKKAVCALESLIDKGYIEVDKTNPQNYTYRLTRSGISYFADRQEIAHDRRMGRFWDFLQLLLAAILGAMASQWLEPIIQLERLLQ